jgi:hypothetical protein
MGNDRKGSPAPDGALDGLGHDRRSGVQLQSWRGFYQPVPPLSNIYPPPAYPGPVRFEGYPGYGRDPIEIR